MPAEVLGPATELNAVNEMLMSIGEAPVSTITGTISPNATVCLNLLRTASRDLQEKGWQFNTEFEVTLTLDGNSKIAVATDVLKIDTTDSNDVAWRGGFLFNLDDNTFVFTDTVEVTLVRHLQWTDLTPATHHYIIALAIQKLHAAFPPPPELMQSAQYQFAIAQAGFMEAEVSNGDYNMLANSLPVSNIMLRTG